MSTMIYKGSGVGGSLILPSVSIRQQLWEAISIKRLNN